MVIKENDTDQQMYPSKEVQQFWFHGWILGLGICFGIGYLFWYFLLILVLA